MVTWPSVQGTKRVSSVTFSSRSFKKESQGSCIFLEAGMGKVFGFQIRQQVPMLRIRGAVRAKPFPLRFRQRIMAERVFLHTARMVQNSHIFRQLSRTLRIR